MKKKIGILTLVAVLAGGMIGILDTSVKNASAGWISEDVLDGSALSSDTLDEEAWVIDDGISWKKDKILFEKNSFEDTKLIHRTQLYADVDNSAYTIKATIGSLDMAGEKRFGIGFGFERLRYVVGDSNTNYAYVEKSGNGYVAGVCSYNEDEEKTELVSSPVALSGTEWDFEIVGAYPNLITVKIGELTVYEGETVTENISGYFGFLETGDTTDSQYSEGYVSAIEVDNDYYDTPENVNIYDDFEDGSINTAVWNLYNNASYLKGVAEVDGMLRFIDSNQSTLTTKYKYSNFEMSLDIPYVKKTAEYNQDGTLQSAACNWFGFFCGVETDDYTAVTSTDKVISKCEGYFLSFRSTIEANGAASGGTTVLFGPMKSRKTYALPGKYDLWNVENEDKILNVMFTCRDGKYNLSVKWSDETEYYSVFTEEYEMKTGYISLCGYGNGEINSSFKANFAYDNVKITNRDYKGQVLSGIEKETNNLLPDGKTDYGYADSKLPAQLLEDGTDFDEASTEGNGCAGVANVGGAAVAVLTGAVALLKRRNRK